MPGGANTTYDEVRDWALDAAGFGTNNEIPCPVDPEVIDTLMLNGLQQVYAQVWKDRAFQATWDFTIPANAEQVAGDPALDVIFDPMYKVLERIVRVRDFKAVYEGADFPQLGAADPELDPVRLCWSTWANKLAVSPPSTQAETYRVFGYRELNRTIWVDNAGVITWQLVDLPDEYMEVYQKIVLGFLLHACGDSQRGNHWLQVSADELASLQFQPEKSRATEDGQVLVMGGLRTGYTNIENVVVTKLPIG